MNNTILRIFSVFKNESRFMHFKIFCCSRHLTISTQNYTPIYFGVALSVDTLPYLIFALNTFFIPQLLKCTVDRGGIIYDI